MINIIQNTDMSIVRLLYNYHQSLLNHIMIFFTNLGDNGIIWIFITLILILNKKTRKIGFLALISLIFNALIVNVVIKPLAHRPRPFSEMKDILLLVKAPKDFSFPSGHTSASFTMVYIIYKNLRKYFIPTLIIALLISFSRLYLSVHYPSDVIAGLILGLFSGFLAQKFYDKKFRSVEKNL